MEAKFPLTTEIENAVDEHEYEILDSPELRIEYIRLTDDLIKRMIDNETDTAIFLDKSARPVAWLVNELWETLAPPVYSDGRPTKKPDIKFLNIDREQWGPVVGRSEDKIGGINAKKLHELPGRPLNELRALYAPVAGVSEPGDKTLLDGKRVLVVDEVSVSGDTSKIAGAILNEAFGNDALSIDSAIWMPGQVKQDPSSGTRYNSKLPVWYSDKKVTGRLVGNRDTTKSARSPSSRQRVGRYWLSAAFREPDTEGRQLKKEVKWVAEDLRNRKILYVPGISWSADEAFARANSINGLHDDEFIHIRRSGRTLEEQNETYVRFMADIKARETAERLAI